MALQRRNGRSRATLLFLVLTSITVITLDFRGDGGGIIGSIRDVATDGFAPVRDAADSVLSPIGDAVSGITGYDELEAENARLQERIGELARSSTAADETEAAYQELLALNDIEWIGDVPAVAARVVSAPVSNFEQTIELNRGERAGIRVDMPVVAGEGLVGRVVQVTSRRSRVRLITDPVSSVGVRLSSGETGIAEGEGAGRTMSVGFIDVGAEVARGDVALTSGLEGGSDLYPADIPVGRVVRAQKVEGELQQQVDIRPLADVTHLRFVKVLRVPR